MVDLIWCGSKVTGALVKSVQSHRLSSVASSVSVPTEPQQLDPASPLEVQLMLEHGPITSDARVVWMLRCGRSWSHRRSVSGARRAPPTIRNALRIVSPNVGPHRSGSCSTWWRPVLSDLREVGLMLR